MFLFLCAATKCHGNRQDQFPPGNLFVSVNEGLWDNGASCGRRYRLKCLSGRNNRPCKEGTIDVVVVDFCSRRPCPSTMVLSNDAFAAVSHSPKAKINIEYIQYEPVDPSFRLLLPLENVLMIYSTAFAGFNLQDSQSAP